MMNPILLLVFLFLSLSSYGQTSTASSKLLTSAYAGVYSYGKHIEKERTGSIIIYPETDSTILFYIDLNRGAPSYNMGTLYGRAVMKDGRGLFYEKYNYSDSGCQWGFVFERNTLLLSTINNQYECGFGFGVFSDGIYKRHATTVIPYFESMEGERIFFNETKPETFNKDR
ncbi:MAG: hypothetical protein JWO58_221 [Chitinophagaceae bacterium]|nr:hypothetical protein [Chitinophagaceae bacterium]